ncbi:sporulation integral membrane protein YtvI [Paenibacillus vortex V453]|jgi:sporulation integral membrane protein YtvI|uniref:Sporulation protein n=2 Tax=Paenibacillus TaxID=44249 RepID=A0A163FES4_9BACL|nr:MULTISPECIES: sporulation integral membrane protein YtvI [Paenibacillus]ANA78934.1 sporulation protein [Paenibacillus glucanolyticus]AVV57148.1 sporulation integral membrane protein YtvI [Paenibacillus glucanolyticus]AWP26290.1 sporulation integral membrane protein YtvI [Paenibacillus sp. Cedars]EFU39178.1 sporulation integral membrane protein YtvI [Paenibacillus vortex V453]ETT32105.1 sporulation integral membrane protein YtvI [Paenibacillus sp. FSL R5-808]
MSIKQLIFIGLGLFLLYGMFTVGAPFLLAIVIAIALEPLNRLLMKRLRLNRIAAATATSTLFLLLLLLLAYLIGLQVFNQLVEYWSRAPQYFEGANEFLQHTIIQAQDMLNGISPGLADSLTEFMSNISSYVQSLVNSVSSTFLSFAKTLPNLFVTFIVFCVAVYLFAFSLDTMRERVLSLFDETSQSQVNEVLLSLKKSIFGFLRAQLILSLFTYVITLLGLLILGINYPLAIALLVTIVDILPILGVGSVLVPWSVYLLATGDVFTGLGLIFLFILITVIRRVLEPKVIGDAVGIGALPALVSMYVGFKLVGVIGFFIGPLVVIIYSAMRKAGLFQIKIKF